MKQKIMKKMDMQEHLQIVSAVVGTTGIIFVSGIILFNFKNAKIYNLQNGEYKLVKRAHISKSKKFLDSIDKMYK